MFMASNSIIEGYGEGLLYSSTLPTYSQQLKTSGLNTLVLAQFHVNNASGTNQADITFNNILLVSNGQYKGDPAWAGMLLGMIEDDSTIKTLLASIIDSWSVIQDIYNNNNGSFEGTQLQTNFQVLYTSIPAIKIIDMDVEDTYDQTSFVAFCEMLIDIGYDITFCPYTCQKFWVNSLFALNASNPGAVRWWNLQCYDGGTGNDPGEWGNAILQVIPDFDINGYIVAGDWTYPDNGSGDCPSAVQGLIAGFNTEAALGGGFLWTIDHIFENQSAKDPATCDGTVPTLEDFVQAIQNGFRQQN